MVERICSAPRLFPIGVPSSGSLPNIKLLLCHCGQLLRQRQETRYGSLIKHLDKHFDARRWSQCELLPRAFRILISALLALNSFHRTVSVASIKEWSCTPSVATKTVQFQGEAFSSLVECRPPGYARNDVQLPDLCGRPAPPVLSPIGEQRPDACSRPDCHTHL